MKYPMEITSDFSPSTLRSREITIYEKKKNFSVGYS